MTQKRPAQLAPFFACHRTRRCYLVTALFSCITFLAGCPKVNEPVDKNATTNGPNTRASVTLRLLVVNDPPLVEAVNRLRGEWAERSGGEFTAIGAAWSELNSAKNIDADVIVFPSRYLGELCTRGWLRPVRVSVLDSDEVKATDFFPTVRNALIKWGDQVMSLPLGVDASVLTPIVKTAPKSVAFAALAAPKAVSKERIGMWFDTDTLKPRIAETVFVDALTQLQTETADKGPEPSNVEQRIPVLGYNDRLIAVTNATHNAASAFRLIAWLAQPETSSQLARVGNTQLPARHSLASSAAWYEAALSASDRAERGKRLEALLSAQQFVLMPRIPGVNDYLAALDDAIMSTGDETSADTALERATEKWEKITDSRGRDAQRRAYQNSLNIAD